LYSASMLTGEGALNSDRVNGLGDILSIPRGDILNLIKQLQSDGLSGLLSIRPQTRQRGKALLGVLSAFGASGASVKVMLTRSCTRRRRSGPAARPRARRG
jgi:hypothetical protein